MQKNIIIENNKTFTQKKNIAHENSMFSFKKNNLPYVSKNYIKLLSTYYCTLFRCNLKLQQNELDILAKILKALEHNKADYDILNNIFELFSRIDHNYSDIVKKYNLNEFAQVDAIHTVLWHLAYILIKNNGDKYSDVLAWFQKEASTPKTLLERRLLTLLFKEYHKF